MRRFLTWGLIPLAVVFAIAAVGLLALPSAEAAPVVSPTLAEESPCVPDVDKWAYPPVILLGETVDVTLTVRAVCAGERFPLHIVLVLDASGSMAGTPTQQMKQAAAGLIRGLDMDQYPATKVGVVEFNSTARTLSQLTNEERRAVGAINRVGASGGTRIDAGIQEGIRVMRQGRGNEKDITEVMVVLSDGGNNAGCTPVLQAARQARGQGILMIAICVGSGCDEQCMRQVASSPRYYFKAQNAGALQGVFQQIRDRILNINLKKMVVKDTLSEFVRYIEDSADPEQSSPSTPSQWLQWDDVYIPKDGVTYTLKVQPLVPGYMPTNEEAWGELTDNKGRSKEWTFPIPWVTVLQPNPLVTPETPPPTPTITPSVTPTITPTPTVSPTPTITPTPRPKPIYLPILLREHCDKTAYYPDVVLVLDMSTSMRFPPDDPKLTHVLNSAKHFIQLMQFEEDPEVPGRHAQAAIAGFNGTAWIEMGLSNNRGALLRAVDNLPNGMKQGTRLDLAFNIGVEALAGPNQKPENRKVMIVLTDGLPNRVPLAEDGSQETTVIRAAEAAKAVVEPRKITVYTIGVGLDDPEADIVWRINSALLTLCAGPDPGAFYQSPTGKELERIYNEIWAKLDPCDGRHDWSNEWPPTPPPTMP